TLVERLVVGDELGDLGVGLLRLLEIFRYVDEIIVDLVLVLKSWAERAAHQEELAEIVPLSRLPHAVVEVCVAVDPEQHARVTCSEIGPHRAEILGAALEQLKLGIDVLLPE